MSGKNTLARKIATKTALPEGQNFVDATISFNQGDLLFLDSGDNLMKPLTAEADAATFVGIAPYTLVDGKYPAAYTTDVDASLKTPALTGPEYGDEHLVILKAGDAVVPGAALYADPVSGARNVSVTGTKQIGVYQGKALTAPAGGVEVSMLVGCRFPNDTLKF